MNLSPDEKAAASMREAQDVAHLGHWTLAANRLYYACYYMASALLIDKGFKARSHAGVIHLIGLHFITKDLLSHDFGRLFSRLFEMRQSGDYGDIFEFTEEDVLPYFQRTADFIKAMEEMLS